MSQEQVDLLAYSIALQRAISAHCRGELIPDAVRALCPHNAEKLDKLLTMKGNIHGNQR